MTKLSVYLDVYVNNCTHPYIYILYYDHVDGISEVSKNHDQYLQEKVYPHETKHKWIFLKKVIELV